ncbi:MAG: hypothetical protein AB7T63_06110 [Planctomycetota bacterium]
MRPWLLLLLLLLLALEPPAVVRRGRERPLWLSLLVGVAAILVAIFAIVEALREPLVPSTPPAAPEPREQPLDPAQLLEPGYAPVDLYLSAPSPAPETAGDAR